jgi:NitT/TauT family transport system substrate-binding protein
MVMRPGCLLTGLSSLLVLAGCGVEKTSEAEGEAQAFPIQIQTDWHAQPEHAGFYQAWKKGFYAEAGLDAQVLPGIASDVNRQKVARGEVAFGIARIDDLIVAVDRGLPLVGVVGYMQRTPLAFMVHPDNPVEEIEQLDGRTVMASPGGTFVFAIQRAHDIELNIIPHTRDLGRFVRDPELIQQVYLTSEPYHVQKSGIEPRILSIADAGYDTFRVLYTSRGFLEDHPEIVRKTVDASLRGWRDYLGGDDPNPAHKAIAERNPRMDMPFMEWTRQVMIDEGIITGKPEQGVAMHSMEPERIAKMNRLLVAAELIEEPVPEERLVTREFLPE